MAEEQIFRLINYYEDGSIRDLYEDDDIEFMHAQWLEDVVDSPTCLHRVEIVDGEVLWENDINQVRKSEEPRKIWKASREKWETKKMQCIPWYKFGYTDFWE
jgi:hypothetical protein